MDLLLPRNITFSVLEALVTAASLFLLFKLMILYLPLQDLGVWSLVAAATSMARLGDLGVAVGVTRFVAKAIAEDRGSHAAITVETALITVTGLYIFLTVVAYFPLYFILHFFLNEPQLSQGRQILPLALVSFVLVNMNSVTLSSLAGMQRSYIKSIVVGGGFLVLIASSIVLLPSYHLLGILIAQIFQAIVVLFVSWIVLQQIMPALPYLPLQWSFNVCKELISYGAQIQLVSILTFFFEPVTKMIMSSLGGLDSLALFEMANRLVVQTRSFIGSANQSLVPAYADLSTRKSSNLFSLFDKNIRYTTMSVVVSLALFAVAIPATSIILLGRLDQRYISFAIILAIGWLLNMLTTPIYFLAIGLAKLKYNTISHFIMAIACAPAAIILGHLFGAVGVVTGATISLILGTLIIFLSYIFVFRPMRADVPSLKTIDFG
jgi:O-antigen/teichoic acid export membrane protein